MSAIDITHFVQIHLPFNPTPPPHFFLPALYATGMTGFQTAILSWRGGGCEREWLKKRQKSHARSLKISLELISQISLLFLVGESLTLSTKM